MTKSTGDRVSEAVTEHLELLTKLKQREDASIKAAGARSKVRSDTAPENAIRKLIETWGDVQAKSTSRQEAEAVKINNDMDAFVAQQERDLALAIKNQEESIELCTKEHAARVETAMALHEEAMAKVRKAQEVADRKVTADAHVAEAAFRDMKNEVQEHRVRIQKALGVDLAAFVGLPEGK